MKLFSRLNPRSIRFKLPAMFMMVSAIPALVALIWLSSLLNERMEQILQQRVRDSAIIAENVFKEYTEDLLLKARLISENRQVPELLASGDKIALINQLSAQHQDLNLSLYGAGIEIFDQSGRLAVSEPKRATQQVPDTMVYTVLKRGEYKISTFFQQDELVVSAALPLFHPRQATPAGVVALSYHVSHKLADEIRKIAGAEVLFFVNPLGSQPRILATTLDESSSEELVEKYVKGMLKLEEQPEYLLSAIKGSARNGEYQLAAAVETRNMLSVIDSLQRVLYFVMGAAVLLALIFAFGLSRSLVGKIVYLVRAARKVEHGELDNEIQLESNDEFGTLARNLDSMRREIKLTLEQKEGMIAKLLVRDLINRAMIRESGNELLKSVLMIILDSIGAQKGSIMMADPVSETLVLKVVYDPDQASEPVNVLEHITFTIGEGIAGQVAASGEAIICNDTRSDGRFKTYRFQEMDRRIWNMICIPLKVDNHVLGVISLDNKVGGFQEADLAFV
ncbi:MAG: GAF domain-containing protein, partial [Candidatus Sericytochromatia bacterium]